MLIMYLNSEVKCRKNKKNTKIRKIKHKNNQNQNIPCIRNFFQKIIYKIIKKKSFKFCFIIFYLNNKNVLKVNQ